MKKKLLFLITIIGAILIGISNYSGIVKADATGEWMPNRGYTEYPSVITIDTKSDDARSATYTSGNIIFDNGAQIPYESGYTLKNGSQWKIQGYYSTGRTIMYDLGGGEWARGSEARIPVQSSADAILSYLAQTPGIINYNGLKINHVYGGQWDPFISGYWGGPYVALYTNWGMKAVVYQDGSVYNVNFLY